MKDKQWKDCWDVALGVAYIPLDKLDPQTDLASLEDGGTFDDETMPDWMKNVRGNAHSQQQPLMTEATALGMPLQAAVDPALAALHGLALPPGPPPGMAPFGLPPGMPPGGLAAPGLLGGIMPPRFGPPPTNFSGLPPSFDKSQPPPVNTFYNNRSQWRPRPAFSSQSRFASPQNSWNSNWNANWNNPNNSAYRQNFNSQVSTRHVGLV